MYYLNIELMEKMCHRLAVAVFDDENDPISPFKNHTRSLLDSALQLPQQTFGGKELYPTLTEKAAILYYTLHSIKIIHSETVTKESQQHLFWYFFTSMIIGWMRGKQKWCKKHYSLRNLRPLTNKPFSLI